MQGLKPYKVGSVIFDKVGELVGALLNLLACKAYKKYVKGKEVQSLVANGLFIHKATVIFHVQVTLCQQQTMLIHSRTLGAWKFISRSLVFCNKVLYGNLKKQLLNVL